MDIIKRCSFVTCCITTLILIMITGSLCNASMSTKGYYPVSSKGECCTRSNAQELPRNELYKDWCKKNFINGDLIYEAYRQIAFDVKYTPEPPRVDFWQTPFETMESHKGDCEDAILLFHSLLPANYRLGEVVWGFVHILESQTFFPHVWYQLQDKDKNIYIVEPFSGDWNGIIPLDMINCGEFRQRILSIPNMTVSDIMATPSNYKDIKNFFIAQIRRYDWLLVGQVDDIFTKLAAVSRRNKKQIHEQKRLLSAYNVKF